MPFFILTASQILDSKSEFCILDCVDKIFSFLKNHVCVLVLVLFQFKKQFQSCFFAKLSSTLCSRNTLRTDVPSQSAIWLTCALNMKAPYLLRRFRPFLHPYSIASYIIYHFSYFLSKSFNKNRNIHLVCKR